MKQQRPQGPSIGVGETRAADIREGEGVRGMRGAAIRYPHRSNSHTRWNRPMQFIPALVQYFLHRARRKVLSFEHGSQQS